MNLNRNIGSGYIWIHLDTIKSYKKLRSGYIFGDNRKNYKNSIDNCNLEAFNFKKYYIKKLLN